MASYTSPNFTGAIATNGPMYSYESYKEFECGIHDLKYKATKAGCPVCDHERELIAARKAIRSLTNELAIIKEEAHGLRIQVDMVASIREAASLLSDEDQAFFKLALYQHRDEKSISVKPTRNHFGQINGLLMMHRTQQPVAIECNSVGGLAIAEYLGEAINTYGQPKAMEILTRALAPYLPGSLK